MSTVRVVLTNIVTGAKVADLRVVQWQVVRRINNTGTFSFQLPMILPRASQLENYCDADIQVDGISLMVGRVDKVNRKMSGDKTGYIVSGLGEPDALARFMSKDTSHYQDVPVQLIVSDLLTYAGWELGDATSMVDPTIRTTIDLRSEEHLLPQIQKACESVPGLFWRYGGINTNGNPTLDIGYFDDQQNIHIAQESTGCQPRFRDGFGAIKQINFVENRANLVHEIAAYGGNYDDGSGDQLVITLADAVAAGVIEDPGFPIMIGDAGQLVVRNLGIYPVGGTVRKQFDIHVTENGDPPTNQEIDEAAQALYWRAVRYLQENGYASEEYNAQVTHLKRLPQPGDRIWVDANQVGGTICSPVSALAVIPGFTVQSNLRVGEWQISGAGDKIGVSFKLTVNEYLDDVTDLAKTFDNLDSRIPRTTIYGSMLAGTRSTQKTTSTLQGPSAVADCRPDAMGAFTGKIFTLPWPTTQSWVNSVTAVDIVISSGYVYTIQTAAAWPGVQLALCVAPEYSDWNGGDVATVSVVWQLSS